MTAAVQDLPASTNASMTPDERRSVAALAGIYATRMLGLFLLLPVLALYLRQMPGATPGMIGLAMGVYGLAQVVFQVPFGRWSDRYGRRPVIALGLILFLIGSLIGALAHNLWMIVLARAVQGAGAMSAAVTALLADTTREVVRTRAMAFIGISIGGSFVLSLIVAPVLDSVIGVPGIFVVMAGLALVSLWALSRVPVHAPVTHLDRLPTWRVALLPSLRSHFVGIFTLHFVLQATFLSVPFLLVEHLHIAKHLHWEVYLGVFVFSLFGTVALVRGGEKSAYATRLVTVSALLAAVALAIMALYTDHYWTVMAAFTVFFAAFNYLEAKLPSGLTAAAPLADRGAALGVFSTSQFLGSAAGGFVGGQLLRLDGVSGVLLGCAALALVWAAVSLTQVD